MTDDELRQQLADITTELYRAGVITAIGGNLSVRAATREGAAWITPSAIFKGALRAQDMVLIDFDGRPLEGNSKPSVESAYHGGIYRLRPDISAVVHSHAPLAIVFGLSGLEMAPITAEAVLLGDMPVIPWHMPGSKELAADVLVHFAQANAAFLCNHGLITTGKSLRRAADATLAVEETTKILLTCRALGIEPSLLPPESVALLRQHASAR